MSLTIERPIPALPDDPRAIAMADFALVRVAMLPYDAVLALVPAAFRSALRRAATAQALARETAEELSQALHAVVPLCPDQKARRAVLALRRALFGDTVADPAGALALLRAIAMPADVAALAERWHERDGHAERAGADLAAAWDAARAHGHGALRELFARETISRAVSVASPELIDMLARGERGDRGKRLKAELSLARYITRAATKTSPFSSLTGVLPSEFGPAPAPALDLSAAGWETSVRVNRALCAAVDYATSDLLAAQPAARVVPNASLRIGADSRVEWCEPDYFAVRGRPWRLGRSASFRVHPMVAQFLGELDRPARVDELAAALTRLGLEPAKAHALLAMLLKRGALRNAEAPDAYAAAADASMLRRDSGDPFARLSPRFARLREHAAAVRGAGYLERERVLTQARCEADALVAAAGIESDRLALKNVLLETCLGSSPVPVLSAGTRRVCEDVARIVQGRMAMNPVYGALREFFVSTLGEAGRTDLVSFVRDAAQACGDPAAFTRLTAAARRLPAPAVAAPFTIFGQLCGPADGARFVVNSITSGIGLLSARYAGEDNDGSRALRAQLKRWIARCANGAVPTDVALAGDCNDLQAHPRLTERVMPWAGDFVQPERAGVDRAEDLVVEYDAARYALRVRDRAGRDRSLSYLGAVYLNAAYGPEFFLQVLGQPYVASLPEEWTADESWGEIQPFARAAQDGIVFRRATWLVRTSYLRSWFAHGDVRDLVHIRQECEREGIPGQFFAKAVVAGARRRLDAPLDARKPQWIDSENPLCLALLRRLLDVSPWIEIAEMLPERHSMARGADGLPHAAEIQFEITV